MRDVAIVGVGMTLVILISAYPIYYSFLLASSDSATIAQNPVPSLVPGPNLWDNLLRVVESDIKFWPAVLNSVIVGLGATVIALILGTLSAFALSRFRFYGKQTVNLLIVLPIALPGVVTGVAFSNTFSSTSESELVFMWRRSSLNRSRESSSVFVRLPLCASVMP